MGVEENNKTKYTLERGSGEEKKDKYCEIQVLFHISKMDSIECIPGDTSVSPALPANGWSNKHGVDVNSSMP